MAGRNAGSVLVCQPVMFWVLGRAAGTTGQRGEGRNRTATHDNSTACATGPAVPAHSATCHTNTSVLESSTARQNGPDTPPR